MKKSFSNLTSLNLHFRSYNILTILLNKQFVLLALFLCLYLLPFFFLSIYHLLQFLLALRFQFLLLFLLFQKSYLQLAQAHTNYMKEHILPLLFFAYNFLQSLRLLLKAFRFAFTGLSPSFAFTGTWPFTICENSSLIPKSFKSFLQ